MSFRSHAIAMAIRRKRTDDDDQDQMAHGGHVPELGTGKRFSNLEHSLGHKPGVNDPKALAASIMFKKFGKKRGEELAHHEHMAEGGEVEPKTVIDAIMHRRRNPDAHELEDLGDHGIFESQMDPSEFQDEDGDYDFEADGGEVMPKSMSHKERLKRIMSRARC